MSRIRTIKPAFFKNDILAELPALTRLFFIGLWTQADVLGRVENRPKRLKAEIMPYDDFGVEDALEQLTTSGFVECYSTNSIKVIQILTFTEHQRITGTEASSESQLPDKQADYVETSRKHSGNTKETVRTTGREGKGRERKGRDVVPKHFFFESPIFEKIAFTEALKNTQYREANIDYYHERINNWSQSKNETKNDWLATAKNWMAKDITEGKFITNNFIPPQNGKSTSNFTNQSRPGKATNESVNAEFAKFRNSKGAARDPQDPT